MLWWNLVWVIVARSARRSLQRDCHAKLFYRHISPPSAMICHLLVTGTGIQSAAASRGLWQICRALGDNSWSCLSALHHSPCESVKGMHMAFIFHWYLGWQCIDLIALEPSFKVFFRWGLCRRGDVMGVSAVSVTRWLLCCCCCVTLIRYPSCTGVQKWHKYRGWVH